MFLSRIQLLKYKTNFPKLVTRCHPSSMFLPLFYFKSLTLHALKLENHDLSYLSNLILVYLTKLELSIFIHILIATSSDTGFLKAIHVESILTNVICLDDLILNQIFLIRWCTVIKLYCQQNDILWRSQYRGTCILKTEWPWSFQGELVWVSWTLKKNQLKMRYLRRWCLTIAVPSFIIMVLVSWQGNNDSM